MDSSINDTNNTLEKLIDSRCGQTLEKLIDYYETSSSTNNNNSQSKIIYGLSDFNNVETADRKLLINEKLIFWVHDAVLNENCSYFKAVFSSPVPKKEKIKDDNCDEENSTVINIRLFEQTSVKNSVKQNLKDKINDTLNLSNNDVSKISGNDKKLLTDKTEIKNIELNETKLTIPSQTETSLFFDVLLWMYTKDHTKLKKFAKNFGNLLHLISLGIFLKMKEEYFKVLIDNSHYKWDKNLFNNPLWSKNKFSFNVLERLIPQIDNGYFRIYALLSWLKCVDPKTNKILNDHENIRQTLKSKELFLVKNYIKKYSLMADLKKDSLIDIKNTFKEYICALDSKYILDNFIFSPINLRCVVCNQIFHSAFEVELSPNCTITKYHPPAQLKCSIDSQCKHKNCNKKARKGEYPCCHKKIGEKDSGCLVSEGKHIIVLESTIRYESSLSTVSTKHSF